LLAVLARHGADLPTLPPPPVEQVDAVYLLFDASGSMGQNRKLETAKEIGLSFLDALPDTMPVAVGSYTGTCPATLHEDFTTDHDAVREAIEGLSPGADTPLYAALDSAVEHVRAALREGRVRGKVKLVLLSDGQNNTCGGSAKAASENVQAAYYELSVDTVGFGSDADTTSLKQIAACAGSFYEAQDGDELRRVYEDIADRIEEGTRQAAREAWQNTAFGIAVTVLAGLAGLGLLRGLGLLLSR
jgi:uncharacterized protein YegL